MPFFQPFPDSSRRSVTSAKHGMVIASRPSANQHGNAATAWVAALAMIKPTGYETDTGIEPQADISIAVL